MELKVMNREGRLRQDGWIPAVVYDKQANRSISIERKAFDKVFRQTSTHGVVTLTFDNGEKIDTLVKAVSMDKRKRVPEHADFLIVSDEPVEVNIPIHTKGIAKGVKESNGMLDIVHHTVHIKASPKNIPHEFLIDVTNIGLNQPIHAGDLPLPEGVVLMMPKEETILVVHPPRSEEAKTEVVAPSEPEVIAKGKKEEEE